MQDIIAGQSLLRAGNVDAAKKIAEIVLAADQGNIRARELFHDCLHARNEYKQALSFAKEWVAAYPETMLAHVCYINSCIHCDKKKDARSAIGILKSSFPHESLQIKVIEGMYDLRFGNGKRAAEIFAELGQKYPEYSDFVFVQGVVAYKRDKLLTAHKLFREGLKYSPNSASIWRLYAFTCFYVMQHGEARKAAHMAMSLDPTLTHMKKVVWLSWLVYFPVFYITAIISSVYYFASEYLGVVGAVIVSILAGHFIFAPMLVWMQKLVERTFDVNVTATMLLTALFSWVVIQVSVFTMIDYKKEPKIKDVQLKDY